MAEKLAKYKKKRDFEATPEPAGGTATADAELPRFVIQEHQATRLHWDLRLEHDGVAASWAIPNGIPQVPEENRKAVHTEDHPLEYLEFEGDIPKGNYGAGTMRIWDRGTYELEKWKDREVMVRFHGERVQGRYVLFQTGPDPKDWMIHRMDPPADPERPFRRTRSATRSRSSGTGSARSSIRGRAGCGSRAATSRTSRSAIRRCAPALTARSARTTPCSTAS